MLSIGIIGMGHRGTQHARTVVQNSTTRLVVVADIAPGGSAIAAQLGVECYSDYRDLLSRKDVDAVIVAVPTSLHYPVAAEALRVGKHVLLEKPICNTFEEAAQLIQLSKDRQLVLAVGHIERFNPAFVAAREQISEVGAVLAVQASRTGPDPVRVLDSIIMDLGVHEFDLIANLLDAEVKHVSATASCHTHTAEDFADIRVELSSGVRGAVHLHWFGATPNRTTVVTGERATLSIDYLQQSLTLSARRGEAVEQHVWSYRSDPLRAQLEDFVSAVTKGCDPRVTALQAAQAVRAARAAIGASCKISQPLQSVSDELNRS